MAIMESIAAAIQISGDVVRMVAPEEIALRERVADLRLTLVDVKLELADVLEENAALRRALDEATQPPQLDPEQGYWYKPEGSGPYCPTCYIQRKIVVRLTDGAASGLSRGFFTCS